MKRSVLGRAGLAAALAIWGHSARAAPLPSALQIATIEAQSCVSEAEVRSALEQAGVLIASAPAEGEAGTTQLEVLGTPEHLSVQLRGPEQPTGSTTLLPPASCATATDVVLAFLVSTLAPLATPPSPVPPVQTLDPETLLEAVRAELARRGIQLVLARVSLAIERDRSGTWFAHLSAIDTPGLPRTIALGNFDDPSKPRVAAVSDAIAPVIQQLSPLIERRRLPLRDPLHRALDRADNDLSVTLLGASELALGTTVLLFLAGGHAPNAHFSFADAPDAFASASASLALLGGGASFLVPADYRRAVIGVSGLSALGALFTAAALEPDPPESGVPVYATAALAAGSYASAALIGINAILRPPPLLRLRAARRELRYRQATPEEAEQVEADLAATDAPLPSWLVYCPLIIGGAVSTMPTFERGSDDERAAVALVGATVIALGMVGALLPSNNARYRRERRQAGLSDIALGPGPGVGFGISLSGRF